MFVGNINEENEAETEEKPISGCFEGADPDV
jgi:hypothetical protein